MFEGLVEDALEGEEVDVVGEEEEEEELAVLHRLDSIAEVLVFVYVLYHLQHDSGLETFEAVEV